MMIEQQNNVGEHPYLPQQAFLYFPEPKDQRAINQKGQIRRFIFEAGVPFQNSQNEALAKFEQYLKKYNIVLDPFWDRGWKLRWLTSTGFNIKNTVRDMNIFDRFRQVNKELKYTPLVEKNLENGMYYIAGRDAKFRPVLVFDIKKIVTQKPGEQDAIEIQTYFFEFIIRHMLIPGQVQTWVAIIDAGHEGVFSFMGPLKTSITFLSNTYRNRMFALYIVGCPSSVYFMWKMVKSFMEQETIKKINLFNDNVPTPLLEYMNPNQLQIKFGGLAPNLTSFWPPTIYSNQYACKSCPIKLLTQKQYRQKFRRKQLNGTKVKQSLVQISPEPKKNEEPKNYEDPKKNEEPKKKEEPLMKQNEFPPMTPKNNSKQFKFLSRATQKLKLINLVEEELPTFNFWLSNSLCSEFELDSN